ncbi:phosphotransferase family protein [Aliidiomarina sedimenti]|uniref:Phosphotransferase family protein n=1 Tax=Aliidiomarina sedimenti TaxID=1933879 RepID=A0ABY0C150_9GAMM|nr:phosphotransferase family protein [Aliidiomarina sedimenti]RUO31501.1 phosphotransferase family protein [Aliidiomarina sedimenti]
MSNPALIDTGSSVRDEETFDVSAVSQWLASKVDGLSGEPEVTQFTGGASNWTYRLFFSQQHDFILRRGPAGTKARSAHDMGREYKLQSALKSEFSWVPEMIGYCADTSLIGSDFYVMRRIAGIIPRKNMPRGLSLSEQQASSLCRTMLDKLVALHSIDIETSGLHELGKGAGYAERQVSGWSKRYRQAKTWNVPSGNKIMKWLAANLPKEERLCMTHNDYRLDNLILNPSDPTDILAVLDWELATIGDPLMDVGNMLAYWIEADDDAIARSTRRQPTHLPGMFTRRQIIDYYCEKMGIDAEDFVFYEVYGLFRLSAIAQQIYYRYYHKQTSNKAFKRFWFLVHYLHWRCRKLIRQQGR